TFNGDVSGSRRNERRLARANKPQDMPARRFMQTMTKREDLRKEFLAVAELRLMKVEELRELLSVSPGAAVEEVLRIMKCWQDSGDGSTPAELRSQAHRLLSEIDCLNGASSEILDKLRPVAPATASMERNSGYDA